MLVNTKPSSADCDSKDILGEFQKKVSRLFLIHLGLPKFLIVGGFVLLRRGRQSESAQSLNSTIRPRFCHLEDMKISVTRLRGRFV